jgi:hypothetical protein
MERMPVSISNLGAAIAVAALFLFAQIAAPNSHRKESKLSCSQSSVVASFADMDACTKDPQYRVGCACGPIENPWSAPYHFGLVPLLVTLFGYITLKGSIPTRLAFLNGAISIALVIAFVVAFIKEPNSAMALPFLPLLAAGYCVIVTVWFFILRAGHSIKEHSSAT